MRALKTILAKEIFEKETAVLPLYDEVAGEEEPLSPGASSGVDTHKPSLIEPDSSYAFLYFKLLGYDKTNKNTFQTINKNEN